MVRSAARPRPALIHIRLGTLAALAMLTMAATTACDSGTEGDSKLIAVLPPSAVVTPPPVSEPDTEVASTPGFVVPENVTYAMAESAFAGRRYSEAAAMFAVVTERKPTNPWNHYMLGLSSWKAGDHARAESAFKAALEQDPKHIKSELNLTRVLLEAGRAEDALVHAERGLAIDSTSSESWRLVGRVQGELRKVEPSLAAYRKAIALDEKDVWSMNNMGLILIREGRFAEALGALARAVEIEGGVAVFQNNLGMALERSGYVTAAAAAYEKALGIDSSYARARVNLARVQELEESPLIVALDLPALASAFVTEVRNGLTGTVVMVPPITPIER